MAQQPLISMRDVTFSYNGSAPILQDFSLDIKNGEHLVLKGESGSGKTTLFRLLLGFERPTSGSMRYKNNSYSTDTIKKLRKELAWLPQDLNLGSGTVEELLDFLFEFQANRSDKPEPDRIRETFQKLGLDAGVTDSVFSELSTGQRQRVGIAFCYLLDKKTLLLDEPTSALDSKSKQRVSDLLFDGNRTIVSTSHDPWWLERCDRIIELE